MIYARRACPLYLHCPFTSAQFMRRKNRLVVVPVVLTLVQKENLGSIKKRKVICPSRKLIFVTTNLRFFLYYRSISLFRNQKSWSNFVTGISYVPHQPSTPRLAKIKANIAKNSTYSYSSHWLDTIKVALLFLLDSLKIKI